jgi:hypothetical protein
MFAEHQPLIREYAMQSADHTADVGYFVLATIQQQFSVVRESYWDMKDKGLDSKFAWGSKAAGMKRIQATKEGIYKDMFGHSLSNGELLLSIASIPGLGLVKAGFYIQLCTGCMGCLDVHNLKRFGLDRKTFLVPESLSWETALGKANMYLQTIEKCGGSEYLWDSWCDYIAALYPKKFRNGEHVSQCHVDYLINRKD